MINSIPWASFFSCPEPILTLSAFLFAVFTQNLSLIFFYTLPVVLVLQKLFSVIAALKFSQKCKQMGQLIMKVVLKLLKLMTQEFKNHFWKHFRVKLFIRIFNCTVYHCVSAGEGVSGFSANLLGQNLRPFL